MPSFADSIDRREFLKQSSAVTAGAAMLSVANPVAAAKPKPMNEIPLVDTHHHLWDLTKFRLPWTKNVPALNKSFLMSDYLQATKGLNVVKTVYMEVDVHPDQHVAEAEFVTRLCRDKTNPMVAAVISGRPGEKGFADYIRRFKDNPYVKGVRQVLHVPSAKRGLCLEKQFVASMRLLGKLGLSYDLCIRPGEISDARKLVEACPDTRFILDHCGNESPQSKDHALWRRDLTDLAKKKNIVCKISGQVDKAAKNWKPKSLAPVILHALDEFGPDRVMFGGDWPVCTLRASFAAWVGALKSIVSERTPAEQRKLFHDNAVKFYGLT